jgi:hypothetical protein
MQHLKIFKPSFTLQPSRDHRTSFSIRHLKLTTIKKMSPEKEKQAKTKRVFMK